MILNNETAVLKNGVIKTSKVEKLQDRLQGEVKGPQQEGQMQLQARQLGLQQTRHLKQLQRRLLSAAGLEKMKCTWEECHSSPLCNRIQDLKLNCLKPIELTSLPKIHISKISPQKMQKLCSACK